MKRGIILTMAITLILGLASCNDDEHHIFMAAFELPDGYEWNPDTKKEGVYKINSLEDLNEYINPKTENIKIDFDNKTLLWVPIMMPDLAHYISYYRLTKKEGKYSLYMLMKDTEGIRPYETVLRNYAFLINKIENNIPIELTIKR